MSKKPKNPTMHIEGIGECEYERDYHFGMLPIINETDSDSVRTRKERYIKKKLHSVRTISGVP